MNENKLFLKRTVFSLTLTCNLNCKLCAAYAPYVPNKTFPPLEQWVKYMEKYFSIVDSVEIISISGGEPLLYKYLPNFLDKLLDYSKRFEKLEILTNGTLVPNEELLKIVIKYGNKFDKFLIDDYGKNLSKKIPEIVSVLKEHSIAYEVRDYNTDLHCGGWVDFGITEEIKHETKEACEELFSKCAYPQKLKFCFSIRPDGYIIPCPPVQYRIIKRDKIDPNEYIDLTDEMLSIEQQRKKIDNICNAKCLETCAYCNGLCDDSVRYMPAEQLSMEELTLLKKDRVDMSNNSL